MKLGTKQIGTVTVVYVAEDEYGDKAGWITQSYPTNFHSFWQEKTLVKDESVDNYKWVGDAEKATIEANDAKWEEPSEEFVKQCTHFGATYNANTGYFEMCGLVDLTEEQMRLTMRYEIQYPQFPQFRFSNIRLIVGKNVPYGLIYDIRYRIYSCPYLEILDLGTSITDYSFRVGTSYNDFINKCSKLKKIIGWISINDMGKALGPSFIANCPLLEDVNISGAKYDVSLPTLPSLSYYTMEYMVNKAANTSAITITLHLDVYCKLISSMTAEEAAILFQDDEAKLARWKEIKATLTAEEQAEWKAVWDTGKIKNISFAY